jgi:hypothetical protein
MPEDILDLDIINPEPKTIKFSGQLIKVNPPTMGNLMAIYKFSQKMTVDNPDYEVAFTDIKNIIGEIVPELKEKELSVSQVMALIQLISNMSNLTPTTTETSEKKV